MVAKFDYDSRELSPNVDAEQVELSFHQGDMIIVFGEMDEDGFYVGELNGVRGLVPSNFLEPMGGAHATPSHLGAHGPMMSSAAPMPNQQPMPAMGQMVGGVRSGAFFDVCVYVYME